MDGTLQNKEGKISIEDRLAISAARKKGVIVSLCTGRVLAACKDILEDLELDGCHIFFDGALVWDSTHNTRIYSKPITPKIVQKACELAERLHVHLDLFSAEHYFVTDLDWRSDLRRNRFGILAETTDFGSIWQREEIIKGGILIRSAIDIENAKIFADSLKEDLTLSWSTMPGYPDYHFINVISNGVSKGIALQALAGHYDLNKDNIIAVGDGTNDLSLLEAAGLAVAMQNSPLELLSLADYLTADVDHNGVAQVIHRFVL